MHILLISRSSGRSRRRVATLLDSYAIRTGESSWSTPITREALLELRAALRRLASRTTCVGCYVNVGRSRLRLAWTVGRSSEFEPTGATPVAITRRQHKPTAPLWVRRMSLLAAASGLAHDIGKASCGFQRKLRHAGPVQDAVRHEWLSMQVRRRLRAGQDWRGAWNLGGREGDAMTALPGFMRGGIATAMDALDFLVVSHHGLLGPKRSVTFRSATAEPDASLHIRPPKDVLPGDTFQPQAKLEADLLADMQSKERRLQAISAEVTPAGWWASALFARAALVFADHTVSGTVRRDHRAALYANTCSLPGGDRRRAGPRQVLNQSLVWHLGEVGRRAATVLPLMFRPGLQGISPETVEQILAPNPLPGSRFQWQDAATDALVRLRERHPGTPALVLNLAGTGSGKTRMNAKAACALARGPVRFSIVLNLRSLTLQTGDAIQQQLHVGTDEMAVVIGDAVVRQLHESRTLSDHDENPPAPDYDVTPGVFDLPQWLAPWVAQHPPQARLLGAPLLVSTMDYLIAAGEPHRQQHHVSALLRLLSSDLVIDEIDSYDPKALVAVLRLIYMAGLCGRNVIASSATLAEPVAQAVGQVYLAGVRSRRAMKGQPSAAAVPVVLISDGEPPECLAMPTGNTALSGDTQLFPARYRQYIDRNLSRLDKFLQGATRLGTVVPVASPAWWKNPPQSLPDPDRRERGWMTQVLKAARKLHTDNAWLFPESASHVSFGLIRVANIQVAVRLARFIADQGLADETVRLQVACYHSQELLIQRHLKEARLDHLLSRGQGDEHLHRDPDLIARVRRARGLDVIFIVVATPVEEIGRDHDFDWAVIEPSSSQSIVQTAGRVNRHRLLPVTQPNIAVLDLNYRAAVKASGRNGPAPVFVRPGLEGDCPEISGRRLYPRHALSSLLGPGPFAVDARMRFRTEQYLFSKLDDGSLAAALARPIELIASAASPAPDRSLMTQAFYDAYPLREPDLKTRLQIDPELAVDHRLRQWELTDDRQWLAVERSYGGTEPRHALDWLAWSLQDLMDEAQRLDLPLAQCLSVGVTLPTASDGLTNPLDQVIWDRSFGFCRKPPAG